MLSHQKKLALAVCGVLLLSALSVLFYVYSSATPREPEDFGGLKWGSSLRQAAGMKLIAEDGDLKFYEKENDSLKMDDAKLSKIVYGSYKDRFYSVMVYYDSRTNFDKLRKHLSSSYGEPTQPEQSQGKYFWNGESVNMLLVYDEASQSGRISCFFKPLQTEVEMNHQ